MSIAGGLHLALERGARARLLRRADLREEPAAVGRAAAGGRRGAGLSRGAAVHRRPRRLRPRELPDQPRQPRSDRVGAGGELLHRRARAGRGAGAVLRGDPSRLAPGRRHRGRTRPRGDGPCGEVLRRTRGYRVRVALENTAGGGGTVGRTFGELGALLDPTAGRTAGRRVSGHLPPVRRGLRHPLGRRLSRRHGRVRARGRDRRACWRSTSTTRGPRWARVSIATSTSAGAISGCRPSGSC